MTTSSVSIKKLFPGGHIPRRAVVCDGLIVEREKPDHIEIDRLSAVCDLLRRECGDPMYSRNGVTLIAHCLDGTDVGAWTALRRDVELGDCVDWTRVQEYFSEKPFEAERVARAPLQATSPDHLKVIMACVPSILRYMSPDGNNVAARALVSHARQLVDVFSAHCRMMRAEDRDVALGSLGKLLVLTRHPPTPELSALFVTSVIQGEDDALRFFVYAPILPETLQRGDVVDALVGRSRRTPPGLRHTLLAVLLRCARAGAVDNGQAVETLALETLRKAPVNDTRLMLACAGIVSALNPGEESEVRTVAHALEKLCVHCARNSLK